MQVKIYEQGNGWAGAGDYARMDGGLVQLAEVGDTIHTGDARGNYVYGVARAAEWSDCDDEAIAPVLVERAE